MSEWDRSPGPDRDGGRPRHRPASTPRTFVTPGGLGLRADVFPGAGSPPVLLLHGGGQTRNAWGGTAEALARQGWPAIALDLRGHGESDWSPDHEYTIDAFVSDVRAVATELEPTPVLVGASLGGLSALLAVTEPPGVPVAGLVLVDVAHRVELGGVQRIVDFMTAHDTGFDHLGDAAGCVARHLPHRSASADHDGLRRNLRLRDGRWHWHWDPHMLAGARRMIAPDVAAEGRARLDRAARMLTTPTLLVRGGMSDVVTHEIAEEFARLSPVTRVTEVRGAGHMVAGDRNDDFTRAVVCFLRSLPAAEGGRSV